MIRQEPGALAHTRNMNLITDLSFLTLVISTAMVAGAAIFIVHKLRNKRQPNTAAPLRGPDVYDPIFLKPYTPVSLLDGQTKPDQGAHTQS